MRILNITNGSYKKITKKVQPSVIHIDGIDLPQQGAIVFGFSASDAEKHSIIQCFNDTNHIYAFGHDPENSAFSVTYLVFLGKACMKDGKFSAGSSLSDIVNMYNDVKVSKRKATVDVTYGNGVTQTGIVLSLNMGVHDQELNTVLVTVSGKDVYSP